LANDKYFGQAEKEAGLTEEDLTDFNDETTETYYTFTYNGLQYYIPAESEEETTAQFMARINDLADNEKLMAYSVQGITKSEAKTYEDVILHQANDGTGRYESMTYTADGKTHTYKLTQQTVQDEDAYEAAMDTYTAKKAIYDKTIDEIDQKTALIQQQDRTLELHLDQLDTEQQAIQTEMDAVKKVIDKNIEETFKTFA